jgi:UDP-galactopyranose mutase
MGVFDAIVIGSGLSGSVVARYMAEVMKKKVLILERRNHVGGNMYDYVNEDGVLVHKYGPHTFHTNKKELFDYMCKYSEWDEYKLTCGAVIDNIYTPTPFNFQTVDDFFDKDKATAIKEAIKEAYPNMTMATVLEMLNHKSDLVREYATFLFEKDYSLYTAKQWGVSPDEIDPSVLKRVPIRFNYEIGYFDDIYQVMPKKSFAEFFLNILNHPNIHIQLNADAMEYISLDYQNMRILLNEEVFEGAVIYTGAIDELFNTKYGSLPYRSLKFEWKTEKIASFQNAPVVAYPQAEGYTRITEYTKLPVQNVGNITSYAIEYSIPYKYGMKLEPYYPVLTQDTAKIYNKYAELANEFNNLYLCGRLADFKYYNMDQALDKAIELCKTIR